MPIVAAAVGLAIVLAISFGISYLLALALCWAVVALGGPILPTLPVAVVLFVLTSVFKTSVSQENR